MTPFEKKNGRNEDKEEAQPSKIEQVAVLLKIL